MYSPRILIAAPQHQSKDYCFEDWYRNVKLFTYPYIDILLVDNSDGDEYYNYLSQFDLNVDRIDTTGKSTLEKMEESHNRCRQIALDGKYDYLFHLETDLFPQFDIIEKLLSAHKKVVGSSYHIYEGAARQLCVFLLDKDEVVGQLNSINLPFSISWLGNGLQKVFNTGLGCTLIHKSVLQKIKFRIVKDINFPCDAWFGVDCAINNIDIFNDSNIFVEHKNLGTWSDGEKLIVK